MVQVQGDRYEVLTNSKFYVELSLDGSQDPIDGYFMECQGFKRSQEIIAFAQVTPQKWGSHPAKVGRMERTKIPGNSKSENIILRRGLCISDSLWKWFKAVEDGNWAKQRRNGDITIYNQHADIQVRFRFRRAWPTTYKLGDLKASGTEFELEDLELAVEDFVRVKPDGTEY